MANERTQTLKLNREAFGDNEALYAKLQRMFDRVAKSTLGAALLGLLTNQVPEDTLPEDSQLFFTYDDGPKLTFLKSF